MTSGVIFEVSFFSTLSLRPFFLTQQRENNCQSHKLISLQPSKMSRMNLIQNCITQPIHNKIKTPKDVQMWKLEFSLLYYFLGAKSQEAVEPNEPAAAAKDGFVPAHASLPPSSHSTLGSTSQAWTLMPTQPLPKSFGSLTVQE